MKTTRALVRSTSFLLMLCCSLAVRAQEVVNDDLIVIGRACVGIDCIATGEGGLDIIKMKHNNTKLLFDDTSTSPGSARAITLAAMCRPRPCRSSPDTRNDPV